MVLYNTATKEARINNRIELNTFCPTSFVYNSLTHHALMINISDNGACFQLNMLHDNLQLKRDDEKIYTIRTPYGNTFIAGIVIWSNTYNSLYTWGVEFHKNQRKSDFDPLKQLIDSSF